MTLAGLYQAKGKLITQLEILSEELKVTNQEIGKQLGELRAKHESQDKPENPTFEEPGAVNTGAQS